MNAENNDKVSRLENNEYSTHGDRRRREKEHLLNAPYVESNNSVPFKHHEKDHHVQFRVSPLPRK